MNVQMYKFMVTAAAFILSYLSLAVAPAAAYPTSSLAPLWIPQPNDASLPYGFSFYDQSSPQAVAAGGCGHALFMYWNVSDRGLPTESINVLLTVQAPDASHLSKAWFAIGLGKSMMEAQFIVCHQTGDTNGSVVVHEHITQQRYAPPTHLPLGPDTAIVPLGGGTMDKQATCFFSRRTSPPTSERYAININEPMNILWAFNPIPDLNYRGEYFSTHGTLHRGAVLIQWGAGAAENIPIISFAAKQAHGHGMMCVWLLIFPFGAWCARYMRFVPGWIYLKVSVQISGIVGVVAFLIVILTDVIYLDRPHAILGLVIIGFVFLQMFLGVFTLLGLSIESLQKTRRTVRVTHYTVGFGLLLAAIAQIYLGLDTLYPWVEPRGKEAWYAAIAAVGFWILMFIGAETYWRIRIARIEGPVAIPDSADETNVETNESAHSNAKSDNMRVIVATKRGSKTKSSANLGAGKTPQFDATFSRPLSEQFTWESLDLAICNSGRMLVVGNGRYVYDISRWIHSHPGGQIILHAVNGTDVSNDYFREAGFDADEFTPKAEAPAQRPERQNTRIPRPSTSFSDADSIEKISWGNSPTGSSMDLFRDISNLTATDWQRVIKARRTHVHTRLAIERLVQLIVGEIHTSSEAVERYRVRSLSSQTLDSDIVSTGSGGLLFDRYEYRRYAMTARTVIGGHQTAYPIVQARFCLLYPMEIREGTPKAFLPGECIEIQTRINNQIVNRYYSPLIGGNLTAFDIVFQVVPRGVMTPFLNRQRCGDRQFKIRGPFGSPIVSVDRTLRPNSTQWMHSRLIFICGGTGITPFLQLINYVFLPLFEKLRVMVDYLPSFDDELRLSIGDIVVSKHHYYDGWAYGMNLTTRTEGIFPLSCTMPRCGPRPRLVLINSISTAADIVGKDIMQGALLAHPHQIQINHFVTSMSTESTTTSPTTPTSAPLVNGASRMRTSDSAPLGNPSTIANAPGNIYEGHLTERRLISLLTPLWNHEDVGSQRCIICGPSGFAPFVVDALTEFGAHNSELLILPSDQWIENI